MLDDHLAHALRRAHDRRRVDSLVGRDEDETVDAKLVGERHGVERAEHVVLNRLARAHFHERHMLVRRRMKHDVGMVLLEDVAESVDIAHAADFDLDVNVVEFPGQIVFKQVRVVFVHVVDDDAPRRDGAHLAAQLRTDRSAAARHEDGFPRNITADHARVEHDFLASEQVRDIDLAQRHVVDFVHAQLADVGKRPELAVGLDAARVNLLALVYGCRRYGHDDLLDVVAVD